MTNDLILMNDEQISVNLAKTEQNGELKAKTREFGASIDDGVAKSIDVDANYSNRMFLFSSGRRRRASFIL